MSTLLYYIIFAFIWLFSLLPFWVMHRISDVLFFITYYIVKYRKRTVLRNLRTTFPQKQEEEINTIAKKFYRHFCDFLLEYAKGISLSLTAMEKRMKYMNVEVIHELEKENKSFALVSAHYNNWEWLINFPPLINHKFTVIYRPLKNKAVDRLTKYIRGRFGVVVIPMDMIFREAVKNKTDNNLFAVWFLADQRPHGVSKFWTTFLNHEVAFYEGVEKMSRKLDMAIVFMDIRKIKRSHYEVSFKKLFDSASATSENDITLACVREMENEILNNPEYWLWSHKRFKHSRPENTKLIIS